MFVLRDVRIVKLGRKIIPHTFFDFWTQSYNKLKNLEIKKHGKNSLKIVKIENFFILFFLLFPEFFKLWSQTKKRKLIFAFNNLWNTF